MTKNGDLLNWPLMDNNITRQDLDDLISYLSQPEPMLTQGAQVRDFEREWSEWLGVSYSVFVNSGSSANQITMAALRELKGEGEVIVPTLTWVSDIASVLQAGLEPVFVDIDPKTLGMCEEQVLSKITSRTKAVFITHILGYNALTDRLIRVLEEKGIPLIEDVCESHGATHRGRKCGSIGWASNFSYYYAHHMSTIEGGMVSTNDEELYEVLRMFRSHGMVREISGSALKDKWKLDYPDLNPDFIFAFPAYNVRSTELNAVIGRSQLKRLDQNNTKRLENLTRFLGQLNPVKYRTDFALEGSSNYAFTLVLQDSNDSLRDGIESALRSAKVEFRRGTSGGGNQLRQPYLRKRFGELYRSFPAVDHIHKYGWYIGNYPGLESGKIDRLCDLLNAL